MYKVFPIPAFTDNYIWVIENNGHCAVVDPGTATPVLDALAAQKLNLVAIILTHHHADHTGGVKKLRCEYNVPVYGPSHEATQWVTHALQEGDEISIHELGVQFSVLDVPGHTSGHIAYYDAESLFIGDTLFAGGCGRLFEGTAAQMHHSLSKLLQLKETTKIYCAHEYTSSNLKFALAVEPNNQDLLQRIDEVQKLREQQLPTIPSLLSEEKLTNPFLRCGEPSVRQAAETYAGQTLQDPVHIFSAIRKWKDSFS